MRHRYPLAALLLLAACAPEPAPPPEPAQTTPAPDWQLPDPELAQLDQAVQRQLAERRAEVAGLLADPAADRQQRAEAVGDLGRHFQAQALFEPAARCYQRALELSPQDYRWAYLLGHTRRRQSEPEQSLEAFARAVELRPDDVPSRVWLAEQHVANQQPEQALPHLERALELDPHNAMALYRLGVMASERGEHQRAVELLERALELQPDANRMQFALGMAYRGLGDLERAQQHLEQRGDIKPSQPDPLLAEVDALATGSKLLLRNAGVAFQQGRLDDALRLFRSALEIDPEDPSALLGVGSCMVRLGRLEDALRFYQAALQSDPDNALAHFNHGTTLARLGQDEQAIASYERALQADPADTKVLNNLGNSLLRMGRRKQALERFREVLEHDPVHAPARGAEIVVLIELERWHEALQRVGEARHLLPDDPRLMELEVRLLAAAPVAELRDGERAVALASELMRQQPRLTHAVALAMAHAEQGEFEAAEQWQASLVQQAEQAGNQSLAASLRSTLELYRRGQACRNPLE